MTTISPEIKQAAQRELLKREATRELKRREYYRDIIKWAQENFYVEATVAQPEGLVKFEPHQRVILRYAFKRKDGHFPFQTIIYSSVKKSGKALAINTPIPTPDGWTNMDNIAVGDMVFDENGNICNVTFTSEIMYGHDCYIITFSDGSSIVADAGHQWQVEDLLEKYKTKIMTTEEMVNTGTYRKDGANRYRIPVAQSLKCNDVLLPVDPYVLGIWLGDGNSRGAQICTIDKEILLHITESEWVKPIKINDDKAPMYSIGSSGRGGSLKKKQDGLTGRLKRMGLINNKHIPNLYLRASYEQRLSLLQGLMDSDGYISKPRGTSGCECEYSTNMSQLADGVIELIRTLGFKPTLSVNESKYYGRITGYRYRIKFHATSETPVFRLKRKLERQRPATDRVLRSTNRHIVDICPAPSIPVKCIQVDSPSHLYLAGRGMIPTHNTMIGGLVGRWAAETWGKSNDIYFVGNDAEQAKERGYAALKTSVELNPDFNRKKQSLNGQWRLLETVAKHIPTGTKVHAVATDYKGEAGSNPVVSVWTELWGFIDKAALRFWAEMAPSPTRPDSIRFIETYAGYVGESLLLEGLYENIVTEANQLTVQDLIDVLGDEYEPGCFEEAVNPEDKVPMYANYETGMFAYWDSGEQARRMPWQKGEHGARYYASEQSTQTESQHDRLHRNNWTNAESEFIPIEWWDACINPLPLRTVDGTPDKSLPLVVSLDAAVTGDCFGLVVVSRDPDSPDDKVAIRSSRAWTPPSHGKIDFDQVGEVLRWLKANFHVVCVTYDPYQLEYFAKKYREELELWFEPFEQGQRRLKADKQFYDLISHKMLRHDGNPEMRQHIQNCNAKIPKEDDSKIRLVKKSETLKIDLAVAASMGCAECLRLSL